MPNVTANEFSPQRRGSGRREGILKMKSIYSAAALGAALAGLACTSAASADGAASTRNIMLAGSAAAYAALAPSVRHKKAIGAAEHREQTRRQATYKAYFFKENGYYPTPQQVQDWYLKTYGAAPH
jgi:hypothetical protein